ncbi:MAG TPA: hypothetical protein VEL51_07085 [Vicinamibacterales bacterium]|nr:hypothetical protein [Vicinamibacterales bacterium]
MVKKVVFTAIVLAGLLATPNVALADDDGSETCATDLLDCYAGAAKIDSFWYRWAAGVDCELKFANCARIMVIGA